MLTHAGVYIGRAPTSTYADACWRIYRSRTYVDNELLSDSLSQGVSARADALGALRAAPGDAAAPAHAAARKHASANNAGGWQGVASLPPGTHLTSFTGTKVLDLLGGRPGSFSGGNNDAIGDTL
jgi:hypothetical protein